MGLYEQLVKKETAVSLVGLGYVGMPIAVAFSKKVNVIGFDINEEKIALYKSGIDPTNEVGNDAIKDCGVEFTSVAEKLKEARFHIVAVPTPVNEDHTPDLTPVGGQAGYWVRILPKAQSWCMNRQFIPELLRIYAFRYLKRRVG